MSLSAVPDQPDDPEFRAPRPEVPTFEGHPVAQTRMVVRGMNLLECDDRVLQVDDIVHMTVEARVTGVSFNVDEANGKLLRVQRVKAIDVYITPWNPDDPDDHGVLSGQ